MGELKDDEVIINLKLLKLCWFYSLIDPNGKKIFGYQVYRLLFAMIFLINHTLVVYSNLGFFVDVDYKLINNELLLILFADLINFITFFKISFLFYRLDKIVDLLDVTRIDFLTSKLCRKNNKILYGYRDIIKNYTNSYFVLATIADFQWIFFAFLANALFANENADKRIPNIVNMPFPIKTHVYNQYYVLFFVIESMFTVFLYYCSLMIDIFLLSYGWIITFQYEVLSLAFKDLKHKSNRLTVNDHGYLDVDNIKTILFDQLNLFLKFKSFHEVSKPIVLAHVALNSSTIVVLTFIFILIYSSPVGFSITYLLKVGITDLYLCLQLYLYCTLFDNMNRDRDSVNNSIYFSDWTSMDLKAKKLLLLAMQMNNANQSQIKVTPRRIIDLQQYASVMTTSYNIVSVMVNTLRTEN